MYINYTFVIEREEPCEGRLSSTVPWEREGETPLRDPTIGYATPLRLHGIKYKNGEAENRKE